MCIFGYYKYLRQSVVRQRQSKDEICEKRIVKYFAVKLVRLMNLSSFKSACQNFILHYTEILSEQILTLEFLQTICEAKYFSRAYFQKCFVTSVECFWFQRRAQFCFGFFFMYLLSGLVCTQLRFIFVWSIVYNTTFAVQILRSTVFLPIIDAVSLIRISDITCPLFEEQRHHLLYGDSNSENLNNRCTSVVLYGLTWCQQ
eukprot:TRINITY_DN11117_c0_g3_i2.p2 TRINITY_DN11117_c0_g3~~TRINITY_DN11117_c0_g3_i2.p2  ORF type:complete len:201 (+),score=-4.36 TRINITY_DN11117_c0_g3_i2:343-945(+)